MKVTFPHLGDTYIVVKILFDALGIDYVIPPRNNKEALQIGANYSPEDICLPFKIMIGNYVQSIDQGADTILFTSTCGPCRMGEYAELQMSVLRRMGYDVEFIVVEGPDGIGKDEFLNRINRISQESPRSQKEKIRALWYAYQALRLINGIHEVVLQKNGYEMEPGTGGWLYEKCKEEVMKTQDAYKAIQILKAYKKWVNKVPVDLNKKPLKVGIIGEIYTVIEPFANHYILDQLMEYGVSIEKLINTNWWLHYTLLRPLGLHSNDVLKASNPYLAYDIGAYARETVGEAVLAEKKGLDGVIQVLPVGCMPEIVSKSILPSISKDQNIPIMTLVFDEMTGEAGYRTRIEAFLDMIERRKQIVLSGS